MGEQVFGIFALGLDNTSWVIVAEIWLYAIFCVQRTSLWRRYRGLKEFGKSIFRPKKRNTSLDIIYKIKIENLQKHDLTAVV